MTRLVDRAGASFRKVFRSVANPGYRKYLGGQVVSSVGTWMQTVAQGLLVLKLSGKGVDLGFTVMLQVLPMVFLSPLAGVWADRLDKRWLLMATNTVAGVQAIVLGLLVVGHHATLPVVYAMALLLGVVFAVQAPAQQSFAPELVPPAELANAVSVNLMTMNVARVLGPAIAGVTAAVAGIGACFLLNGASFLAVIIALAAIRAAERQAVPRQPRRSGQLREGIAHVRGNRELAAAWWMNLVYCMLAWEFEVSVPLLVTKTFGGSAGTYGLMFSALGAGAVVGGAWGASRVHPSHRDQLLAAVVGGAGLFATAMAPNLAVAFVTVAIGGGAIVCWWGLLSAIYQLETEPAFRARAMALWMTALQAGRPAGAVLIGWTGQHFGARSTFLIGGIGCALGIAVWSRLSGHRLLETLARPEPVGGIEDDDLDVRLL